jgi:ribosomal protein S18 acetylase RimI-like enzyme
MHSGVDLAALSHRDLSDCEALSRQEGWPHTHSDWGLQLTQSISIGAFYNHKLVGTALIWHSDDNIFATVGMVIVDSAFRRQGIAERMLSKLMNDSTAKAFSLIATPAGLELYQRLGFNEVGYVSQYQGNLNARDAQSSEATLKEMSIEDFCEFDLRATGIPRGKILESFADTSKILVLRKNNKPIAAGMVRKAGINLTVGPLISSSDEAVTKWWQQLPHFVNGFIRCDLYCSNLTKKTVNALDKSGLREVYKGVLMQKGNYPPIERAKNTELTMCAAISQALG